MSPCHCERSEAISRIHIQQNLTVLIKKFLIIFFTTAIVAACTPVAENPRDVAAQYWQALKRGDTETARSFVSLDSQQSFDEYLTLPPDQQTAIGEINLGTQQTIVVTIIYPEGNAPDDYRAFDTVMVLENGQWKIDATQSFIPPSSKPAGRELEEMAEQLSESMQKNIDSMEDAMAEGMRLLNDALREGSKEMGESMLRGMEELNESMQESIEQMKKRREQQQRSEPLPPPAKDNGEGLL